MAGRPTIYTEKLANTILTRIATGESVRSIGRDDSMPVASTIFDWALHNEIFSEQYDKAKRIGAEIESEEMDEIAITEEDVARAKLRIDTKKWNLSKKLRKRFGDNVDITSGGEKLNISFDPTFNKDAITPKATGSSKE